MPGDFSHYNIYRSDTGTPGTFVFIGTTTSTSFVDSNVILGNTYYYVVTAVTYYLVDDLVTYEESLSSSVFSITFEAPPSPPPPPPPPPPVAPPVVPPRGPIPDNGHRIGTYDYRVITEAIAESYDLGKECLNPLVCMYNNLQNCDVNVRQRHRTELESFLRRTYAYIIYKHLDNQQAMYNAVRALNTHVMREYGAAYGYDSMDEFLIDQFLEVPLTYAILSEQVGYSITVIGDAKARWSDMHLLWKDITLPMNKIGWENL